MIKLLTLSLLCLFLILVILVALLLFSIPFAIVMAVLPWLLRIAAIILLLRGLMESPFHWSALAPAGVAFALSVLLR